MITVFGSINVDIVSRVMTIPKPGETVLGSDYQLFAGGKGANQALAARRSGAEVRLIGSIGDDGIADVALTELQAAGVDLSTVARIGGTTGVAIIIVERSGENTIVVSPGANAVTSADQTRTVSFGKDDTLLLQMEVPFTETLKVAEKARAAGARVIFSLAPFSPVDPDKVAPFSIMIVNQHEATDLARHLGLEGDGPEAVLTALSRLFRKTFIATLGKDGAIAAEGDRIIRVPALPVTPVDTTGAGDTFAGVLAAALDSGSPLEAAMRRAAVAGSLTCTKQGAQASFPNAAEIDRALAR
jgi:ribokinase